MHILIAEDTEDSRVLLEDALTAQGYEVVSAVNGAEALAQARNARPDLIISDILMPVMDGYEFCRHVKMDNALKSIPFVFYSATFTEARDEELAMSLGAARFIIKPEDPVKLMAIIDQVLQDAKEKTLAASKQELDIGVVDYLYSVTLAHKLHKKNAELEASRKQLTEQNNSLRIIHELSNFIHSSSSIDAIVEKTLEVLLSLTNPPVLAIYLLSEDQTRLQLCASHGFDDDRHQKGYSLPLDNTLSGLVLKQGRMLVSANFAEDERLNSEIKQLLQSNNIQSGIAMPMMYQQTAFGCINVFYRQSHPLSAAEIDTLETIGKTVSIALANAYNKNDLEFIAHHDPLTGLTNRVYLHKIISQEIAQGAFSTGHLLLIDLDRFKEINDTLGHFIGDRLLQQVGPRLTTVVSGPGILLSRLGGDEFSFFLPGEADEKSITQTAQRLRDGLRETFMVDGIKLEIDASIGIARFPDHGRSSSELLRSADVAMYEAKRTCKGMVIYDPAFDRHTPERLALSAELGSAIRQGQLVVHFQPKIDFATHAVVGFEALVRWQHPKLGLIYPDQFIHLAEMGDAIHDLTQAVIEMALAQQKSWQDANHRYSVSVNLSARNLSDERCLKLLEQKLKHYGTDPALLELEITETALMQDPGDAISLLNKIAQLGIKLSIDDYGTGYSSLSYLRRLPIDILKIDRSFVNGLLSNEQDAIIVSSTIALAHNLGLKVVAEGIEDQATMTKLHDMGCDLAQGYYISKPKAWLDLEDWLEQWGQQSM